MFPRAFAFAVLLAAGFLAENLQAQTAFTGTLGSFNNPTKAYTLTLSPPTPSYATSPSAFLFVGLTSDSTASTAYCAFTGWDVTTRYFYYSVTANAGYDLVISAINSTLRSSNTGPRAVAIETATDLAGPWTERAVSNLTNTSDTAANATGLSISVPAGTTLYIRYRNTSSVSANGATVTSTGTCRISGGGVVGTFATSNPNAPQISDFNPKAGVAGTPVVISGTNFTGVTAVTFGAVAASIASSSATNIQTTVPAGAITAPITVATPEGTNSSSQNFVVLDGSGTATVQNGTSPYTGKNIFPRNTPAQTLQVVYVPPAAGAIEGLRIEVPSDFGVPFQSNVNVSGGGGTPSAVVSGQTVTVTGLAATSSGNVTVSISGLTAPDTSLSVANTGAYAVNVQSRGTGGTFAAIANSPSALVTIPLANVRNFNASYTPVLSNSIVAVQGTASVPKLANRGINAAIQDETWGVVLDAATAVGSSNLVRGNNYAAIGQITQFQGLVQISITNLANLVNLGAGVDPVAVTATVPQFTNTNTAPGYQSRVVRIEDLSKLSGTWAVTNSVILTNPLGEQVTVFIPFNSTATNEPAYPVNVTGIGGQSDNATPFDSGWRLQPRDAADIGTGASSVITTNGAVLTALSTTYGTASTSTSFAVAGTNMTTGILVTPPTGFEVSTNNSTFGPTVTVGAAGTIASTTVYARLASNAPVSGSPYSGNISLSSSGAATVTVPTVASTVSAKALTITGVTANNKAYDGTTSATLNTASAALVGVLPADTANVALQTGSATGTFANPNVGTAKPVTASGFAITGTASSNYSLTQPTGLTANITQATPTILTVPTASAIFQGQSLLSSTLTGGSANTAGLFAWSDTSIVPPPGTSSQNVVFTPTDGVNFATATTNVSVTVNAVGTPIISPPNNTSLSVPSTIRGTPSAPTNITVNGTNLPASLTVTPPPGWQIAATNASGFTSTPIVIATNPSGVVSNTALFVRLAGTNATATNYANSAMTLVSGAASNNVLLSGSVTDPPPVLTVSTNALTNFATTVPSPSTSQSFTVGGSNLTASVTVTPPPGWQISATNPSNFTNVAVLLSTNPAGVLSNTTLFVRLAGTNATATNYVNSVLSLASGATNASVLLSGTVAVPTPSVVLSTNILSGLITTQGAPSSVTNFFLSASNLATNITITPPDGWQIAVTNTDIFSDVPVTIGTNPAGVVSNTAVFVRLAGTNTGTSTVVYNNSSLQVASGTTTTNALLSGSVVAPPSLTLIVPTPIPGDAEVPARIERPVESTNQAVTVSLVAFAPSLPEDLLFVPQTVVIPAGKTSATFIMRTLPISGPVNYTLYATAEGYQFAQATVVVSNTALAAASLGPGGYRENFQSFTNWATLPFGWTASYAVPTVRLDQNNIPIVEYRGRFIATGEFTPWGTLANYAKNSYQLDTNNGLVNVFGFQFPAVENTPALLDGDRSSQTVFLRNDFTNTITALRVSYRGRTTRSAADPVTPATKNPLYTVSIAVGTNAPLIDGPLSYGTANGDNALRSGQVSGLNIPRNGTFSIDWTAFQQSAVGVSKQIGISEVVVEGISPSIVVSPSNGYGDLTTLQGTPSAPAKPFLVVAENLIPFVLTTNAGVVTTNRFFLTNSVPSGSYQISTNNISFTTNPIVVPIPTNGAVTNTFWVRLSGSAPGVFSGDFRVEGGTNGSKTAPLGGTVFLNSASPQVLPSSTNLTGFSTRLTQRSTPKSVFISARNIGSNPVNVTVSAGYEISLNSGNNYTNNLLIPAGAGGVLNATAVYVRLIGSAVGTVTANIGITSPGAASQTVALTGEVLPSQPVINVTPSQLPIYQASPGEFSPAQMVTVGGSSLLADITITPPLGFQVSTSSTSGFTSSGITLVQNAGVVASTPVYVRFAPSAPGDYSSNVQLTSAGADTKLVAVSGTVEAVPLIVTSPGQLQGFATTQGNLSAPQEIQITGQRLRQPGISVTMSSQDWELFDSSNSTTPLNLPYVIPAASNQTAVTNLFVRISTTAAPNPTLAGAMILSNGPTIVTVPLSGKVCPQPSVSATPTSLGVFDTVAGRPSPARTFLVSGADLLGAVSLSASAGYEISTNNSTWGTSIVLPSQLPPAAVAAQDNAANYGGGWANGANGGTGFQPWAISNFAGSGFAGNFIGNPSDAGIGGMSSNSFGLFANPNGSGSSANAERGLSNALIIGQTLSLQWSINFDSGGGGNKGFSLLAGGSEVINVNNGSSSDVTLNGTNVGFGYGTNAITWSFTRSASGLITVTANDRDGSGTFSTNITVANGAVNAVKFYASAMQVGNQAQPYFNNLEVDSGGSGGCSDAFVADTVVFVRLAASAPAGNRPGTVTVSSPSAANRTVNLNGVVWTISGTPSQLTFYSALGYDSDPQLVTIGGANRPTAVRVTPPPGFIVRDPANGNTANGSLGQFLTLAGTSVEVYVSPSAPLGPINSTLQLGAGSWPNDAASVSLRGRVGYPAENDIFISTMIERLMFRIPTDAEMADYLSLLSGGASGQGTAAQKSAVIMRMMGFDSTVGSANYQTFDWQTSYLAINGVDYTGNWVLPSVAFSPYARLGLMPSETEIRQFVAFIAARPSSAPLNIMVPAYYPAPYVMNNPYNGVPGDPWGATQAMGDAFVGFFNSPTFQANSTLRGKLLLNAQGFVNWLAADWFFGIGTGSADSSQGLIGLTGVASPVGGQGAAAAFRSMYARVLTREKPSTAGGTSEKAFQLRLNLAALDYQLWRNWSYTTTSPSYGPSTVQTLLRPPVIASVPAISATADSAITPFNIPINQASAPFNLRAYFRLAVGSTLPAGLSLSPSGTLSGTPAVSGQFTFSVVAQNPAGDSSPQSLTMNIAPSAKSQARQWMSAHGYGMASMASMASDDSDQDGIKLTDEYAYGGNPLVPNGGLVKSGHGGASSLRLEWMALELGATYTIESSGDLQTWSDVTGITVNDLGASGIYRRREAILPMPGLQNFYRVRANFEPGSLD